MKILPVYRRLKNLSHQEILGKENSDSFSLGIICKRLNVMVFFSPFEKGG
jgi:hypothetical protein